MDIGAIFLILALILLVSLFISRPFFEFRPDPAGLVEENETEQKRSRLLAEYDQTLNAIQELEFDHSLGKIPEEEFPYQRTQFLQDAAELLRELDSMQAASSQTGMEERIEAAINSRRATSPENTSRNRNSEKKPQLTKEDQAIETMIALRRGEQQSKASGFCPQCGKPVQKSDKFCPKCGASLLMVEKG